MAITIYSECILLQKIISSSKTVIFFQGNFTGYYFEVLVNKVTLYHKIELI